MYKWWCVIVLLFVAFLSLAQEPKSLSAEEIDNILLKAEDQRTGDVKNYEKLLSEINAHKFQFNDYQRCFYHYLEQYNHALLNGFNQSLTGFKQLFEACEDPRVRIRIKNMEANIYSYMKRYKAAIEALDYSLTHVSDVDDKHLLTVVYSAAFIVYSYIEQYPLSLQFSELLMDESDKPSDQCKGKYNRAYTYMKQGNAQVDEAEINQVFDYCYSVKEPIYAYLLKLEWYSYLVKSGREDIDWNELLAEIVSHEDAINRIAYPYLSRNLLLVKSQLMFKLGDEEVKLHVIDELLNESNNFENSENKIVYLKLMVSHYKNSGQVEKALEYMELVQHEMEQFYKDKQNKQVAYQIVNHESMAGQLQNEILSKQNKILHIEQDLAQKNMLNQRLITAVISLLGLLLIFWAVRLMRKHKVVKEAAAKDYLTGCYNRQTFETQVKLMLNRLEIKDLILHLAIMDLDHFKSVNDRFGHLKGDLVLKRIIAYCQTQLSDRMLLGRLGGEEFGLFIIETNSRDMMNKLNQIREGIAALDFSDIDADLKMTSSFGVASSLTSGYQWQTLISHADEALYQAKARGRNRVYRFDLAHTE
ncbi:GGDEF domain-containing protein [Marinicella rhabdoformis]|uniref:GGDEF domain-containing protein n=1 Tax=Marinicella rhabdoformis TaxID=2580566 RepID=UPI0012AEB355|nr:GGDEF domain-containing protein [Marinicella rhabdoformis]